MTSNRFSIAFALATLLCGLAVSLELAAEVSAQRPAPAQEAAKDPRSFQVRESFPYGSYPCLDCHVNGAKTARRPLARKAHPIFELRHGHGLKCADCHDPVNWGKLALLTGPFVEFKESPELCSQCHGIAKRDWDQGLHGRTTGGWQGERRKLRCIECHDPHNPKFPKMKALPPPPMPKSDGHTPPSASQQEET